MKRVQLTGLSLAMLWMMGGSCPGSPGPGKPEELKTEDPKPQDVNKQLFDAAEQNDWSAIDKALKGGANVSAQNDKGQTVLHVASAKATASDQSVLSTLLSRADVTTQVLQTLDKEGKTSFEVALANGPEAAKRYWVGKRNRETVAPVAAGVLDRLVLARDSRRLQDFARIFENKESVLNALLVDEVYTIAHRNAPTAKSDIDYLASQTPSVKALYGVAYFRALRDSDDAAIQFSQTLTTGQVNAIWADALVEAARQKADKALFDKIWQANPTAGDDVKLANITYGLGVLADAEPFDADALKSFLDDSARRFQTETKSAFKYQLTQLGGSADTLDARDRLLAAYVASEQEVKDTLQTVVVEIQAHPATNPGKGGAFAQAVAGSEEQSLDALLSDAQAGKVDAAGQILKAYAKGDAVKRKALLGQAIAAAARYPSAPRDKSLAVLLEQLDEDSLDLANGGPMDLTAGVGPIIRVKGGALELALKDRLGKFDAKGTLMLLKLVPSKEVEESALDHFMGEALKALKGDAKLYTAFKKAGAELFEDDRIFDYLLEKAVLSPEPGSRLKALLDAKKFENTRTKGVVPQGLVNKMHKLLEEASISRAGECPGYEYELIKAAHKRYNKTPECDLVKILSNIANCSKGVKTNFSCP